MNDTLLNVQNVNNSLYIVYSPPFNLALTAGQCSRAGQY
jgi:hypothetical protein